MSTPIDPEKSGTATRPTPRPTGGTWVPGTRPMPGIPRPSGPPVNQMTEEERIRAELAYYDREINAANSLIQDLQNRIGALADWQGYLKPIYEAQIEENRKTVAAMRGRRAPAQNKLYEVTGQYEKLLAGAERDAFSAVSSLFRSYGLETLAGKIFEYVKNGYSADTISILLQDTKEYKERFIGNEARRKAGLPVLSPAEYLSVESSYQQIMRAAGMPQGFWDSNKDFADLIGKNVSPTELQNRVDLATQANTLASDYVKKALKQIGLSDSEMVSYWLDEDRSLPTIQKAMATAQIGAEALRQGLSFDTGYAQGLAQAGITADQARQGYSAIAQEIQSLSALGSIYGEQWDQRESERAMFEGAAGALQKKKRLASQERAQFGGAAGAARGGLAQRGGAR